jgi:hypothetical protein
VSTTGPKVSSPYGVVDIGPAPRSAVAMIKAVAADRNDTPENQPRGANDDSLHEQP